MASDFRARSNRSHILIGLASLAILAVGASPATAAAPAGTLTSRDSMIDVLTTGGWAKPLITVGDPAISGYSFEAIPDGISVFNKHGQTVEFS